MMKLLTLQTLALPLHARAVCKLSCMELGGSRSSLSGLKSLGSSIACALIFFITPCLLQSSSMDRRVSDSSDKGLVAELVRWHLPAHSLGRFKGVSKEWKSWCLENLSELAKVRRQTTASRDWYFPISISEKSDVHGKLTSRTWSAIHHASCEEHEKVHRLPHLNFLPNWLLSGKSRLNIEAASGGLLLCSGNWTPSGGRDWYVVNPLTRKWRHLSGLGKCCRDFGMNRGYKKLYHAHIVVDEDLRKYKVIILTKSCVNVYSSHSEHWVCNRIGLSSGVDGERHYIDCSSFTGSAYANGHVYICSQFTAVDLSGEASDGTPNYLTMIEIQICPIEPGEGQRRPAVTAVAVDNFTSRLDCFFGFGDLPAKPKLVECMGDLYVVASQCDAYHTSHEDIAPAPEVFTMRREFHIFKVQEGSSVCHLHVSHVSEKRLMPEGPPPSLSRLWLRREHFSCTARSSVIWLAWEDRLLQYDVVSNVWKSDSHTNTALLNDGDEVPSIEESCLAYTPSFDFNP